MEEQKQEKVVKAEEKKTETKGSNKKSSVQVQAKYTVDEFVKKSSSLFGVNAECVRTAFFIEGIKEATVLQAKEIVKKFMEREVH